MIFAILTELFNIDLVLLDIWENLYDDVRRLLFLFSSTFSILAKNQRSKSDLLIENFSNYKGIFTLPIINIQQDHLKTCTERATCALVGLAKYTKILDRSYDFKEMKDLMKGDKAMLVGAMLLKIFLLLTCSSPSVRLIDPTEQDVGIKDKGDSNDSYNHLICLMTAHTLSGCMTNVDSFYTYGNKTALCAIRPIKTGEKLILNAKSEAIWYNKTKSARQSSHRRAYGFSCKCQACTENWSNVLDNVNKLTNQLVAEMHCASTVKLWNENNAIALDWKNNRNKPSYPDANIVLRAIGLAKTSWKGLSMPSTIIVRSVLLLIKILRIFYNPSEIYSKMPQLREEEIANIFNPSDFCFCKEHSLEPLKPK
ncbi:hypothetical protein QAD02_011340 [Eretmocerus hayati]|uniref:Uncharacterized protein n=1 Tax=Eretmocerus hayati TaxID=131215 RepID=A0ACC2NWV5_9HYME|nr:hypothetical protein QAD02_011340 [Eretmocerus hayati]